MIKKMVLLTLGGRKFSLSVEQIEHVLPRQRIYPLVCLRPEIAGVFLYNDEPIPMLALPTLPEFNISEPVIVGAYIIVVQSEYGNIGLSVDSAVSIVDVEDGSFEDVTPSESDVQGCHVFNFQDVSYPLLNVGEILARLPY
jgi:chemotaxis signal transduction protein